MSRELLAGVRITVNDITKTLAGRGLTVQSVTTRYKRATDA